MFQCWNQAEIEINNWSIIKYLHMYTDCISFLRGFLLSDIVNKVFFMVDCFRSDFEIISACYISTDLCYIIPSGTPSFVIVKPVVESGTIFNEH